MWLKIIILGLIITSNLSKNQLALAETAFFSNDIEEKVIVYNWSEYIPEEALAKFTEETGIKVEYSTYDSNEVMYLKLKILRGRGYDVVFPSTYLVSRMRDEGLIQPLNHKLLDNMKHLDSRLMNRPYDSGNRYSIPYLWGTTGLGVNRSLLKEEKINSWGDLWHKKWRDKIIMLDDMREVFHIALKINGHSTNTQNPDEIRAAYESLRSLMPNVKKFSGNPKEELESNNSPIALIFNGDLAIAKESNDAFEYIYPTEGTTTWLDSFVVPARAQNVRNAHAFINFMLRPEIAAMTAKEMGYATPNLVGKSLLPDETRQNPIIFQPPEKMSQSEYQKDIRSVNRLYLLYWNRLKSGG
jgi:spermidine/putrescine transport system substrate-binding protein